MIFTVFFFLNVHVNFWRQCSFLHIGINNFLRVDIGGGPGARHQNFTVQHNIEINFEGWGDDDKRRYRALITQSFLLKIYNVSVVDSDPEISNELAIGYVNFSSQDE